MVLGPKGRWDLFRIVVVLETCSTHEHPPADRHAVMGMLAEVQPGDIVLLARPRGAQAGAPAAVPGFPSETGCAGLRRCGGLARCPPAGRGGRWHSAGERRAGRARARGSAGAAGGSQRPAAGGAEQQRGGMGTFCWPRQLHRRPCLHAAPAGLPAASRPLSVHACRWMSLVEPGRAWSPSHRPHGRTGGGAPTPSLPNNVNKKCGTISRTKRVILAQGPC